MDGDREYSLLADPDQWARCRHEGTVLAEGGGVQLDWLPPSQNRSACPGQPQPTGRPCDPAPAGGLAFDRWCTAYRPDPAHPDRPGAMAVDAGQRLYVVHSAGHAVVVTDLWSGRLLRRIPVGSGPHRPVDVAAAGCGALVLMSRPARLVEVNGRRGPLPGPRLLRPRLQLELTAVRLATGVDGTVLVLWRTPAGDGWVAGLNGVPVLENLSGVTDLVLTGDGVLLTGGPGAPLRRFRIGPGAPNGVHELEPLAAPAFDGGALAVAPDGRIAFTRPGGHGWTGGSQAVHMTSGRVIGYRLDSGAYRTRWGRVFVDACVPRGAAVRARFLTTDEDGVADPVEPVAARGAGAVYRPDLTPPLPSAGALVDADGRPAVPLFRRATGREWPWAQIGADDGFETYEAPVAAPPGRYLWVVLELTGTAAASPQVRELRVERPGHRLLAALPRSWSRDEVATGFLNRFLAPAEGIVHELDGMAAGRQLLLNPATTPQEALPWLASFAGLVLDRRWPDAARRELVGRAFALYRVRGTLDALEQILGIYLGRRPVIVERWRLRGIPGAVLGGDPDGAASSVLGAGMRAGGTLATGPGRPSAEDGFRTSAHRFTVLTPMDLSNEQRDVVHSILHRHRPVHTEYDVCELGSGMRIGRRLHLRLSSFVGPQSGWVPAIAGQGDVGGSGVIGTPAAGSRLGTGNGPGTVRVG